jgi:hypothetical protein
MPSAPLQRNTRDIEKLRRPLLALISQQRYLI